MVDALGGETPVFSWDIFHNLANAWRQIERRRKKFLFYGMAFFLVGNSLSWWLADHLIERIIRFFFASEPGSWAAKILNSVAAYATSIPVEDYIVKAQKIYSRFEIWEFVLGLAALSIYLFYPKLGALISKFLRYPKHLGLRGFIKTLISPKVMLAGIVLGFTTGIRVIGPLAGFIVLLFLLIKNKRSFFRVSLAYFLWAILITYLAWPYLWVAPISRYIETLNMMSSFPWTGEVLFNGNFYSPAAVPLSYLPVLMHIQFTEIFIILFYLGLGWFIWHSRRPIPADLLLFTGFGSIFPILGLIALRSPMYDNFRQIMFLLPGLFMLPAFVLEGINEHLRLNWLRGAVILAIAIPGLVSCVQLHPYPYVYYNSFVGGQAGAFRRFEMDYWQTATRELTLDLNQLAGPGDHILVGGTLRLIRYYLRPDLLVERIGDSTYDLNGGYDYAVLSSRLNADQSYPEAEIVKTVERNGAIFGVIKKVKGEIFK